MSVERKPSTSDEQLSRKFGAPVPELHARAVLPDAPPALPRALELRHFLALAEEQVIRVRDRVHEAMAPDRDLNELSAETLRWDTKWLDAAIDARNGYRAALDDLLRTMPSPEQCTRSAPAARPTPIVTLPPAVKAPAPPRAGAARPRRP
ncbi:conserved protein of unknown function [Streptomyces murinus]|uniref:hypothetical protein n=1 Tax=Streptomyces murinus TaxID=33900 RepID=UPI003D67D188